MTASKREPWGSLRKLPSGRWQARYPGPDGRTYTARTEGDKALTFHTKTDARTWLAAVHTKISLGQWNPPAAVAARNRAEAATERARSMGFEEYSERWVQLIKTEPNRRGKRRAIGTVRSYQGKVTGYLVPEFGDTPLREIDADRIRVMTDRLDKIPAPLNPKSKFNGITRPVLIVLMMILRQAARDGVIPAAPSVSIPRQESVRHDSDHDEGEDVVTPRQVEALYAAVPKQWAILVLLAAWCQLRRGECLGLQRRDVEWNDDGSATLHVRRQLNANTGDYTDTKSDAGKRSLSIPKLMIVRLKQHLDDNVAAEAKAPVVPASVRGSMPLSNTRWGYVWASSSSSVPGGWTGPTDAGVRVCSYDRPGYGASSPVPGRTIGDAAEWSRRIADACEVEQFAVMGTSGGGPHAVAAAVALPNRVRALCVDVGLGPEGFGFDASTGMVPETTVEIEAARRGEAALRSHLQSLGDGEDSLADWYERLPPSDQEVLARPEVQREDAFESREWPTFEIDGWVEDDLALFHRGWGLSSISVHVPTLLLYGGADVLVPVSHGHAWHRLIPHAEVKTIPNGGHWLRDHEVDALRWCSSIVRSDDS